MLNVTNAMMAHVWELAGRIGIRYVGSPGNLAARKYIQREMERAGLAVEIQESACPAWSAREAILEAGGSRRPAFVDPFSAPVDVMAPVVSAGTLAELERAELRGKIALLYGDLASVPVSPKKWFLKTGRDERIISLLESKQPAAVLSTQPGVPYFAYTFCDADFPLPSATLPRESSLELLRRNPPAVHLLLETERRPGTTANVIGRLPGARPEVIVFCAHYDTAALTPGACDNAGGVAILLALAAHFAKQRPACGFEFAAFSGHEYLPLGVDAYFAQADPARMIAAINFDGAGHYLGTNTLTALAASGEFVRTAQSKLESHPGAVWVEPWPESDHSAFAMRGVPALAIGGAGIREITHIAADTPDGISGVKLNEAASLAAEIVAEILAKPPAWGRAE